MFTFEGDMELEAIVDDFLYAIKWPEDESHVLDEMAACFSDVEFLRTIFKERQATYIYKEWTIEEAVLQTVIETNEIIQELMEVSENISQGKHPDLDSLFVPLHKNSYYLHARFHTDYQVKGYRKSAPWIRIYAVKCDSNLYVITGYGIKLTGRIQEDPLLTKELLKLERATNFLRELDLLEV